jgi:hypothetical protein
VSRELLIQQLDMHRAEVLRFYDDRPPGNAVRVQTSAELLNMLANESVQDIVLRPGEYHSPSGFEIRRNNVHLFGGGSILSAAHRPALYIPPQFPAITGTTLFDFADFRSNYQSAVQIGDNGLSQVTVERAPNMTIFSDCAIPDFTQKRGWEDNGRSTMYIRCYAHGWHRTGAAQSQGVCIINTPGPHMFDSCNFQGSEGLLVGGDSVDIPGAHPSHGIIRNCRFGFPERYLDDTVARRYCNGLEFKDGHNWEVTDSVIENVKRQEQTGFGCVITPRSHGSIRALRIQNMRMRRVGSCFNIAGADYATHTSLFTSAEIVGGIFQSDHIRCGGSGIFAKVTSAVDELRIHDITYRGTGTKFLDCHRERWMDEDGVEGPAPSIGLITISNSRIHLGTRYGITQGPAHFGNPGIDSLGRIVDQLAIHGNTFGYPDTTEGRSLATSMRRNFPDNEYLVEADWLNRVGDVWNWLSPTLP